MISVCNPDIYQGFFEPKPECVALIASTMSELFKKIPIKSPQRIFAGQKSSKRILLII
jgi:hypothetical protein